MKRIVGISLITTLLTSLLLTGCALPFSGKNQKAALTVTANPKAGVFIDGEHLGNTPYYDEKFKPGEYTIRLVPEGTAGLPWEARITLNPGINTAVSRELGDTPDRTSGYVLSLEPSDNKNQASLTVITNPDGAIVGVDGEPKGFAPISVASLPAGDRVISISSPGYVERSFKAQLMNGYKLTANVQLAKANDNTPGSTGLTPTASQSATLTPDNAENTKDTSTGRSTVLDDNLVTPIPTGKPTSSPTPKPSPKVGADLKPPFITILSTPTGWLNVRSTPATTGEVLKKVNPGESYKFIEMNESGWDKIAFSDGTEGWISSKYAKLTK